jgi:hypothetical protein
MSLDVWEQITKMAKKLTNSLYLLDTLFTERILILPGLLTSVLTTAIQNSILLYGLDIFLPEFYLGMFYPSILIDLSTTVQLPKVWLTVLVKCITALFNYPIYKRPMSSRSVPALAISILYTKTTAILYFHLIILTIHPSILILVTHLALAKIISCPPHFKVVVEDAWVQRVKKLKRKRKCLVRTQ